MLRKYESKQIRFILQLFALTWEWEMWNCTLAWRGCFVCVCFECVYITCLRGTKIFLLLFNACFTSSAPPVPQWKICHFDWVIINIYQFGMGLSFMRPKFFLMCHVVTFTVLKLRSRTYTCQSIENKINGMFISIAIHPSF